MLDERINEAVNKGESSRSQLLTRVTPGSAAAATAAPAATGNSKTKASALNRISKGINLVKSPSDTTIYVPALNKATGPLTTVIPLQSNDGNVMDNRLGRPSIDVTNNQQKQLVLEPQFVTDNPFNSADCSNIE